MIKPNRYLWIMVSLFWIFACEETEQIIPNHSPEIVSFGVMGTGVQSGEFATVFCTVSDEDNDSLSYSWTSPVGLFAGSGDTVYWRAPTEISQYPIYCRVEDGHGGYIEVNFDVQVFPNMLFSDSVWTVYNSSNTDLPPFYIDYLSSIVVDRFDQIWMGDYNGRLYKFDGFSWHSQDFYIGSLDLISIDIDALTRSWIVSEGGHLVMFDGSIATSYSRYGQDPRYRKHAGNVVIDEDDNIWVSYWDSSGPSMFDGSSWLDFDSLGLPAAMDIAIDRHGDIWYTADSALVQYDHNNWTIFEGPVPQWKQSIAIDQKDRIWVATENHELAMFDRVKWTYLPTPFDGNEGWINDLTIDNEGNVWCACDGGIAILDGQRVNSLGSEAWITILTPENSPLPDGWINSLSIDNHGNIWGGAHAYGASGPGGGGLFKIDRSND